VSATAVKAQPFAQAVDRWLIAVVLLLIVDDRGDVKLAEEVVELEEGVASELSRATDRDLIADEELDREGDAYALGVSDLREAGASELTEQLLGDFDGDVRHGVPPFK
jgi:hypothetical protein